MAAQLLLGMTILGLLAAIYFILAWKAAARFGHRTLWLTWPAASLLLLAYYVLAVPTFSDLFTADALVIAVLAIFLAFGLTTRSVWRQLTGLTSSSHPTLSGVARGTGAFFIGLMLGLVPLLVLDILSLIRRS